ncbi:MAG: hypothetical protein RIS94_2267, partial [Pseudomonadota bacterium]
LPGDFLKFIIAWTERIGPIHHLLRKREPDARMSDVELAIRYLAFRDQQTTYASDLKLFLDDFCKSKNAQFSSEPQEQYYCRNLLEEMDKGINSGIDEFGEREFCRKYLNGAYETRFNRAVFDVLVGSLANKMVRDWVNNNPGSMKTLYQNVCSQHADFVKAVETTTKSSESTRVRFSIWYEAVHKMTGISIPVPDIK